MKIIILAIALSMSALMAQSAQAQDCNGRQNYMVMPNSRCIILDYLSILAASRTLGARTNASFQKQFDANLVLETNAYNRQTETKEARDRRLNNLAIAANSRNKVNATVQGIEDTLYPLHLRALGIVREGFRR
ncbi:MAG: hypothetical protein NT070_17275 [Cyanobacteria bacterium]|nr:hypothetical protein [Cyanobacteriota bacterium]